MNLLSPKVIKELLATHNAKPSKSLGQNFLIDEKTLDKIIETADMSQQDTILEVGPGIGTLTQELAKKAGKVIAIEKDSTMVEILKETVKDYKNIEIIQGNALKILNHKSAGPAGTPHGCILNYKVVANIPYYLTSPLIRKLLESRNQPAEIILMVQKEVAQRICSKPPKMGLLAVSVQFYAKPEIISYVSKNCFWPAPKVDSAILKIIPRDSALISGSFRDTFFRVVKAGFSQPRKQLANNLSKALKKDRQKVKEWLTKNDIKPEQRAETLTIKDWLNLANSF